MCPPVSPTTWKPAAKPFPSLGLVLTLGFLGIATNGQHSDTGTIIYSDGTTQTFTLTFPDWFSNGVGGETPDQIIGSETVNGLCFAGSPHVSVYAAPGTPPAGQGD